MAFWNREKEDNEDEKDEKIKNLEDEVDRLTQRNEDLNKYIIQNDTYHREDKINIRREYDEYIEDSTKPHENGKKGKVDPEWLK